MKIIQLNSVSSVGSTGRICVNISEFLSEKGVENYILYSLKKSNHINSKKIMTDFYYKIQSLYSHFLGNYGFNSVFATKRIISIIDEISPDIVHLHNIHGHDCHLKMLIEYLSKKKIKIVWTFHDCWAFTGYCPHFLFYKCDKWHRGCHHCVSYKKYSFLFDRSKRLYEKKKRLLQNTDFTIVTPSKWLADQVAQSFLSNHNIEVINNGIDLSAFKPIESDFRKQYGIDNKKIVLGVAFNWGEQKGLDVFVKLAKELDESKYQIVLVGTDEKTESQIPENIISLGRTNDVSELVNIYTASDVFVNPTKVDTFPTVNMEALACGVPVITFDVGGSKEMISKETGIAIKKDDFTALKKAVTDVCENGILDKDKCIEKAKDFTPQKQMEAYYKLYRTILNI